MKYIELMKNIDKINCKDDLTRLVKAEDAKLSKLYEQKYSFLNPQEIKLIEDYTNEYSKDLNDDLISVSNTYQQDIKTMNGIIDKFKAPTSFTIYRGLSYENFAKTITRKKNTIKTITFYSASLSPIVARFFSLFRTDFAANKYIILELDVPINYPALYTEPLTTKDGEYEVLLNNNSTFEIIDEKDFIDNYWTKKVKAKVIKIKPI